MNCMKKLLKISFNMKDWMDLIWVYMVNAGSFILINISDANEVVKFVGGIIAIIYTGMKIWQMYEDRKKQKI